MVKREIYEVMMIPNSAAEETWRSPTEAAD
jgi:hypothetical protein